MSAEWTLEELVGRVAQALAGDPRAPNGRVTPVPDARMIRWYATIGLVDKPSGMRGRTALYGRRHLWQLVAVKRLQAQGRPLAEIQAELTGAPESTLARVAALGSDLDVIVRKRPEPETKPPDRKGSTEETRERFWAQRPAPGLVHGVRLGEAVLVLPTTIDEEDAAAIRAAAQPLMELLRQRGITTEGAP